MATINFLKSLIIDLTKVNWLDIILNPDYYSAILYIKLVFFLVSFILLTAIILLLMSNTWIKKMYLEDLEELSSYSSPEKKRALKFWNRITTRLKSDRESEFKLAILEADDMLSKAIKRAGYEGKNIEEQLRNLNSSVLPNIKDIWEAHKIRDSIVYDDNYKVDFKTAEKALEAYKGGLEKLKVL